jgi:hypothetical protein
MMAFLAVPQYLGFTLVIVIGVFIYAYTEWKIRGISRSGPSLGRQGDIPEAETAEWWQAQRQRFLRGWILALVGLGILAVIRSIR